MKLSAKYEIEAPADFVYRELADFAAWERMALRRGAEVTRLDNQATVGPGMEWLISFALRGKRRKLGVRVMVAKPISHLGIAVGSALADGDIEIDLLDIAAARTRVGVQTTVKPKSLAARVYIQALRLTRKKVEATYSQRIAHLAVEIEDRYRSARSRETRGR